MRFAVISLNNDKIRRIIQILGVHCHDIDSDNPDFVITYGGDGTVLYSERRYPGIPKITVRGSSGGYKCLYNESDLENVISRIDNGEYKLKEEMKLETTFQGKKYISLNEVQIHNASPIKAVRFSVYIENEILFENVIGDGVIITTPFGSSAYYSSVGGEKFDKGIGIALNNAYNVKYKPVIIDEGFDYSINVVILQRLPKDTNDGLLLFDNDDNMIKVKGGDKISVKRSKDTAKFVLIQENNLK